MEPSLAEAELTISETSAFQVVSPGYDPTEESAQRTDENVVNCFHTCIEALTPLSSAQSSDNWETAMNMELINH